MKKLILLLFILTGCGYARVDTRLPMVVESMESCGKNYTYYYGHGNWTLPSSDDFCIIDSASKYKVGDTIRLN